MNQITKIYQGFPHIASSQKPVDGKGICSDQYKKLFKCIDDYCAYVCVYVHSFVLVHVKYAHMHSQAPFTNFVSPSATPTYTHTGLTEHSASMISSRHQLWFSMVTVSVHQLQTTTFSNITHWECLAFELLKDRLWGESTHENKADASLRLTARHR